MLASLILFAAVEVSADPVIRDLRQDYVEANVPPVDKFDEILRRDLRDHVGWSVGDDLEYEMLQDGPSQMGVGYPKFYLWVRVRGKQGVKVEGAALVAAMDRVQFEVLDFRTAKAIRMDVQALYRVYPASVCERIKRKTVRPTRWESVR